MPVPLIIIAAVSVAGEVAATAEQKKATDSAANTAKQTAQYNANLDKSEANQLDIDAQANIQAMRRDAAGYMSRQASSYARAGVIANTGSALAVQATTAGRFAMQEQNSWLKAQAKEQGLASAGAAGIAEGAAQADQDHLEGIADVMNGASKVAGTIASAYAGGAFNFGGGTSMTSDVDSAGESDTGGR